MEAVAVFLVISGIHPSLIVAGMFGALLSLEDKKGLSGWTKIAIFVSGGSIANYITPLLIGWLNFSDRVRFGIAFILGFSGLSGLKWIILKIKGRYTKEK